MVTITSRDPGAPPVDYIKRSGGIFRDMTIHDFDMARFLLGEEAGLGLRAWRRCWSTRRSARRATSIPSASS
jgi:predicted dehydrogenase